jgi:hypothetical protein
LNKGVTSGKFGNRLWEWAELAYTDGICIDATTGEKLSEGERDKGILFTTKGVREFDRGADIEKRGSASSLSHVGIVSFHFRVNVPVQFFEPRSKGKCASRGFRGDREFL